MDYVGIDLHKKESQICALREGGQLSEWVSPRRAKENRRERGAAGALQPRVVVGAGDRNRTGDVQLGKLAFCR